MEIGGIEIEKGIKITKANADLVEKGDVVIVKTDINKINGVMPTPSAFKFAKARRKKYNGGGMTIFAKDDEDVYIHAFIEGSNAEFYLNDETKITIFYGGKAEIKYYITDELLEGEEITIKNMRDFVAEYLVEIGDVVLIKMNNRRTKRRRDENE